MFESAVFRWMVFTLKHAKICEVCKNCDLDIVCATIIIAADRDERSRI